MEIALSVLSIISLSLLIAYASVVKRLNTVSEGFASLLINYDSIINNVNDQPNMQLSDEEKDIHKENFIKFLSDSRDWAYQYIEDVQGALNKFISEVEPHIEYFDKYGDVLSENRPDFASMKKISESLKELKKVLPEEINDRR